MVSRLITSILLALAAFMQSSQAFSTVKLGAYEKVSLISLHEATGGWGIGQSREISPEEYAKGDRRAFQGYEMTDRGDFMRNVKEEQDMMKKSEMDELLGVAKFAGIKAKNPKDRLNKFEPDVFGGEDDDIDLSV
jgi:hypothetical protein